MTLLLGCLERWARLGTAYLRSTPGADLTNMDDSQAERDHKHALGPLKALRSDVDANVLTDYAELVHRDLFSELLTDAEHLLGGKYVLAAAVVAGATAKSVLHVSVSRSPETGWAAARNTRQELGQHRW